MHHGCHEWLPALLRRGPQPNPARQRGVSCLELAIMATIRNVGVVWSAYSEKMKDQSSQVPRDEVSPSRQLCYATCPRCMYFRLLHLVPGCPAESSIHNPGLTRRVVRNALAHWPMMFFEPIRRVRHLWWVFRMVRSCWPLTRGYKHHQRHALNSLRLGPSLCHFETSNASRWRRPATQTGHAHQLLHPRSLTVWTTKSSRTQPYNLQP